MSLISSKKEQWNQNLILFQAHAGLAEPKPKVLFQCPHCTLVAGSASLLGDHLISHKQSSAAKTLKDPSNNQGILKIVLKR